MDRYVTHGSFTLERAYPAAPARVFAAWADPAVKARWFAGGTGEGHQLDFRVGGREVASGGPDGGPVMTFETFYREIVPQERIVYTSTMSAGADVITAWRENGTAGQLKALADVLENYEENTHD